MRDLGDPPSGEGVDTATLALRIEQLAGSGQAAFMPVAVPLQDALETLLGADTTQLLRALQDLHHAVSDAQCQEGLPAWLGWLGTRHPWRRFQADCREAIACRDRFVERAQRLADRDASPAVRAAGDLARLQEAAGRLDAAVSQAQPLLAALWERLRPQRPDPGDPGTLDSLRHALAEVDRQRTRLQILEHAGASAGDVARLGSAVLDARRELLALVDGRFVRAWADWRGRVEPLLREGLQRADVVSGARDATADRRGLLLALDQMRGLCLRLQIDEQALAHALAQLREQLVQLLPGPTHAA